MKKYLILLFLLCFQKALSQESENHITQLLSSLDSSASIVALGDPTHQEATITQLRIELIKELVSTDSFTIIAIEGNMLELYQAHCRALEDGEFIHYEKAMYPMLNLAEMHQLYAFILEENKKGHKVKIMGFDPMPSGSKLYEIISNKTENLSEISADDKSFYLSYIKTAENNGLKMLTYNKKDYTELARISRSIIHHFKSQTLLDSLFLNQIENFSMLFEGRAKGLNMDNLRDKIMARNIDTIKKYWPEEKIIMFGSSTHLLKNPQQIEDNFYQHSRVTCGSILDSLYQNEYVFIAYSAISGNKFNYSPFSNKPKKLSIPIENSAEAHAANENKKVIFYNSLNFPANSLLYSRFLGHSFLKLHLWKVIDGLVLVENCQAANYH